MDTARIADAGSLRMGRVLDFMRLLWALDHELASLSKRMDSTYGVTGPQRLALRIIGHMPGIAPGHLAVVLRVHPSTLTGILRRLEDRGLLERRKDPKDSRRALLFLTPRGHAIDALRRGTVESAIRSALRRFAPQRLAVAEELLEMLTQALRHEAGPVRKVAPSRRR